MERYTEYKDSGVEWIGDIPSHWQLCHPWTLMSPAKREVRVGDEVITCFRDGVVTLRSKRREQGFTNSILEIGYQRVEIGDLVVHEMDGFAGAIGVSDSEGKSTPVYTVIPEGVSQINRYWMFILREMARSGYILSLAKSIRQRTSEFRWKTWSRELFCVPPVEEQERIAAFLDERTGWIDEAVKKTEKKIALLKEQRASLINEVVTKGLDPNVEMKDSGVEWIGDIPSHWLVAPLKFHAKVELGKMLGGKVLSNGISKPYLRNANVQHGSIDLTDVNWMEFSESELESYRLEKGDLLITEGGDIGRVAIWNNEIEECYFQKALNRVRVEGSAKYTFYVATGYYLKGVYDSIVSRVSIPHLTKEKLEAVMFLWPPVEEQERIVAFLDERTGMMDEVIAKEEERIALLKQYRQSLISEVVTGKRRVLDEPVGLN